MKGEYMGGEYGEEIYGWEICIMELLEGGENMRVRPLGGTYKG